MTRTPILATLSLAALGVVALQPASAHTVSCVPLANPPTSAGTAVRFVGAVDCNTAADIRRTAATVQIFDRGAWRDYGNATTHNSPNPVYLVIADGAPKRAGCWAYRGRLTVQYIHVTSGTLTDYSADRTFCG